MISSGIKIARTLNLASTQSHKLRIPDQLSQLYIKYYTMASGNTGSIHTRLNQKLIQK